jgi:hypothetical protein
LNNDKAPDLLNLWPGMVHLVGVDPQCPECAQLLREYLFTVSAYRQASRDLLELDGEEYALARDEGIELWSTCHYTSLVMVAHQERAHGLRMTPLKAAKAQILKRPIETLRAWLERKLTLVNHSLIKISAASKQ